MYWPVWILRQVIIKVGWSTQQVFCHTASRKCVLSKSFLVAGFW